MESPYIRAAKIRRCAWRRLRITALISMALNLVMLLIIIILLCAWPSSHTAREEYTTVIPTAMPQSVSNTCDLTIEEPAPILECAGDYIITAYCPCEKCCGIWSAEYNTSTDYVQKTASGTIPTEGRTIAADTSVLPFGTTVVIDGHEYIVEDRGSSIKGNRLDIFFESHEDALNWGRQFKTIYIKGE